MVVRNVLAFLASHGAPVVFAVLLWYVLEPRHSSAFSMFIAVN
jgi:hypothetical protein